MLGEYLDAEMDSGMLWSTISEGGQGVLYTHMEPLTTTNTTGESESWSGSWVYQCEDITQQWVQE